MGKALEHLGPDRCRQIAEGLFERPPRISGGQLHGHCPLPGHEDKNPSFGYSFEKDVFTCSCNESGDLIRLWSLVRGTGDEKEDFKAFCVEFGIELEGGKDRPSRGGSRGQTAQKKAETKVIPEAEWDKLGPLPEQWIKRLEEGRGWTRTAIEALDLRLWRGRTRSDDRIAIPVRDDQGRLVNIRLYRPGGSPKIRSWGKGYGANRLWWPDRGRPEDIVWVCEGEPDAITAISKGLCACTTTTGAKSWSEGFAQAFSGRDVVIAYDADQPGQKGALRAARSIARKAKSVRILVWPDWMGREPNGDWPANHGQDLTDWLAKHGKTVGDLKDLLAQARTVEAPAEPDDAGPARFWAKGIGGRGLQFLPNLLAREILRDYELVTDPETELIYRWNGQYWELVNPGFIRKAAIQKLGRYATTAKANDAVAQVVDLARLENGRMNAEPEMICLQNGMCDTRTLEIKPHRREYYATFQLPISADPRTPVDCPRWKEFLDQTVQIPEVIAELQEFFGYCLVPTTKFEKALFLIGPGSDGKSTCLTVLQALVGPENCAHLNLNELDDQFLRASLHNKALNVFTEVNSKMLSSGYFKAIVTGEPLQAAFKFRDTFTFKPTCKLAFSANRFPRVVDHSDGFWRRPLPIRFRRQFFGSDIDPDMAEKLLEELPGIFLWALVGLARLRERGRFEESRTTRELIAGYRTDNNPLLAFVQERCTQAKTWNGAPAEEKKDDLFKAYREFCEEGGYKPLAKNHFARGLREVVPSISTKRARDGNGRVQVFVGIRLISDLDASTPAPPVA